MTKAVCSLKFYEIGKKLKYMVITPISVKSAPSLDIKKGHNLASDLGFCRFGNFRENFFSRIALKDILVM